MSWVAWLCRRLRKRTRDISGNLPSFDQLPAPVRPLRDAFSFARCDIAANFRHLGSWYGFYRPVPAKLTRFSQYPVGAGQPCTPNDPRFVDLLRDRPRSFPLAT